MNVIVDRLRKLLARFLEFWNKYNPVQRTMMIGVGLAVFLAIIIVSYFVTRPVMTTLINAESTQETARIRDLLEEQGISYKLSDDATTIYVNEKDYSDALLILAKNDIPSIGMSIDQLFDNGFSTTESEKRLKANIFKQDRLRRVLLNMENIKDAVVSITSPNMGNTLFEETKDTSVSVILNVDSNFNPKNAKTIANILAGAVGNKNTQAITIADQSGNLLFNGADNDLLSGGINSIGDYEKGIASLKKEELYKILVGLPAYDDAKIAPNFAFDMNKVSSVYTEYTTPEGADQGLLSHSYNYNAENSSGNGGAPGTDANSETDYMIQDGGKASGNVKISENDYLPNQKITNMEAAMGAIKPAESSIAITLISYMNYREEELKKNGKLDGKSFEEFMFENQTATELSVPANVVTLVSRATGVPESNIQILAWQVPIFYPKVSSGFFTFANILMILLAVIIVALLIFVVFRGLAPVEVTEVEPELSVEQLLATTKENQSLEDIEFSDKSEARKMIEKFVDENPEAAAQLLRNWLQDDWG